MTLNNASSTEGLAADTGKLAKPRGRRKPTTPPVTTLASKAELPNEAGAVPAPEVQMSKSDAVLKLLRAAKGASIDEMMKATGWQAHSVRGFLSGHVRKKLGLTIASESGRNGARRYRIVRASEPG